MKFKMVIFILIMTLISCHETVSYVYLECYDREIPEDKREIALQHVEKIVSAASFHMTGGDYEDADDTIQEANQVVHNIYAVCVPYVMVHRRVGISEDRDYVKASDFSKEEIDLIRKNISIQREEIEDKN